MSAKKLIPTPRVGYVILRLPNQTESLIHVEKESKVILDKPLANTIKASQLSTYIQEGKELEVVSVGTDITDLKAGDMILLSSNTRPQVIVIDEQELLVVRNFDIFVIL